MLPLHGLAEHQVQFAATATKALFLGLFKLVGIAKQAGGGQRVCTKNQVVKIDVLFPARALVGGTPLGGVDINERALQMGGNAEF